MESERVILMIGKYTWEFDKNAEFWRNGTFDTVEECIQEAKKVMKAFGEEHTVIYIGETEAFEPYVLGTDVIEHLEEQAYDEFGEDSEGWDPWYTLKARGKDEAEAAWAELDDKLNKVIGEWLKKYYLAPDFYRIVSIEEVPIDGAIQSQKK